MRQSGRPRREDEQEDSPFGKALKAHLRRVEGLTQVELANKANISQKTLSEMVKGKRSPSGSALRRDLRAIIEVLYQKGALYSLDEANRLITQIPAIGGLDERDPEDARIIALFPESQETHIAEQDHDEISGSNIQATSENLDETLGARATPEITASPPPGASGPASTTPLPVLATTERAESETRNPRWWSIVAAFVALIVIFGAFLFFSQKPNGCLDSKNGVTLYTDPDFQGHCHTFPPGEYDLSQFGLDQNVSSLKDPDAAYMVRLIDRTNRPGVFDKDVPQLPADWNDQAHSLHVEKHRPTACHPGVNGIIAFINTDYSGGCLFITEDIPDLTPSNFDQAIVSIQFIGTYRNARQLVLYRQPNYTDECGAYWQNQSDLLQCARVALSVRVLPFTPPTPIPTVRGSRFVGNVAADASLSPTGTQAVVDGNLETEWVGGHMVGIDLNWAFPVTIHRVVVWDRKQSGLDNNQINKLQLTFSDGTATGSIDMISQGPRCVDVTFLEKTVTWVHIIPVDASGNNGLREVEVWATSGPQYSNNTCVNKKAVPYMIPV